MSSYRDHDERSQHQQQHGNGRLPMSDIGAVNKRAQIQGSMMGVGGGIIAALVARRIAPQSSNIIVMSGLCELLPEHYDVELSLQCQS
jgi:hypothetical protein